MIKTKFLNELDLRPPPLLQKKRKKDNKIKKREKKILGQKNNKSLPQICVDAFLALILTHDNEDGTEGTIRRKTRFNGCLQW